MEIVKLFNSEINEPNALDKLESKLEEPMDNKELIEALKSMTPAELLEKAPELYNAAVKASADSKEVQEALANLPTITKDRDELLEKNTKLEKELKEAQEARDVAEAKVKEFEGKEKKEQWTKEVQEAIDASELPESAVTESFKNQLFEQESIDKVNELIEDRKALVKDAKPTNFDNGQNRTTEKEEENEKPYEFNEDQFVRDIKKN